jgi:4-hydroxythreonine-4-phosphate dehydrogenase
MTQHTVVALTLGDPAGVGAELIAKLLSKADVCSAANIVLIGDPWLWAQGQAMAKVAVPTVNYVDFDRIRSRSDTHLPAFIAVNTVDATNVRLGIANAFGGASVLTVLNACMDAAKLEQIDAICFAPLNKFAMKQGGLKHEDELHHFADYLGVKEYFCEFNTLGTLWTARVSSHIPLKDASTWLTQERIVQASQLIYKSLQASGNPSPKVAVAGFNPHNGDGGTCGREELDVIIPAVAALNALGYPIEGPFPADTIFLKARAGEYQAIVTMYHDQGQIAIKLMGFSQGVTVQGGLPVPITTPAHGTAYDIAGRGVANVDATRNAFDMAVRMGTSHYMARVKHVNIK